MSNTVVFNTIPSYDVKVESPLAGYRTHLDTPGAAIKPGIVVRERAFLGHLVLRGNASADGFAAAVEKATGLPLPVRPGQLSLGADGEISIQWISPDEWLIIVPGREAYITECRLRELLQGHYAVMNVSGGQTVLELRGPAVRDVLMKSTPYDVHPRNFPPCKGVSTVFGKATAIIRHIEDARWELVARRSFASYIFSWVLDASEEFGVHIDNTDSHQ